MNDRVYVGKGEKVDKYDLINFSICLSDVPKEDIKEGKNGKKYLNLTIAAMRQVDQFGKTHTVYIDDYKPEKKKEEQEDGIDIDSLPF